MKPIASALIELLGIAAMIVGFSLWSPVAGFLSAGVALIVIGMAIDPPPRSERPEAAER